MLSFSLLAPGRRYCCPSSQTRHPSAGPCRESELTHPARPPLDKATHPMTSDLDADLAQLTPRLRSAMQSSPFRTAPHGSPAPPPAAAASALAGWFTDSGQSPRSRGTGRSARRDCRQAWQPPRYRGQDLRPAFRMRRSECPLPGPERPGSRTRRAGDQAGRRSTARSRPCRARTTQGPAGWPAVGRSQPGRRLR